MSESWLTVAARAVWDRIDAYIALGIAAGFTVWGTFFDVSLETVSKGILAVLTVAAFALVRDRTSRASLSARISAISAEIREVAESENRFGRVFGRGSSEQPILESATEAILLLQETGSQVFERDRLAVVSLLKRGGRVRVVLAAPTLPIAGMLSLRNANLTAPDLLLRAQAFPGHIRYILAEAGGDSVRFDIRYLDYPTYLTGAVVDELAQLPSRRSGLIRLAGFALNFPEKLDLKLNGSTDPDLFSHFAGELKTMYHSAPKFVVLSGPPRCGKTTLLASLVSRYQRSEHLFSIISEADVSRGRRTGFRAFVNGSANGTVFAKRNQAGEYDVEGTFWDDISRELLDAARAGKVIILDEIGQIQLRSARFRAACQELLSVPNVHVIASSSSREEFVEGLRKSPECTVYELLDANTAEIGDALGDELRYSLRSAEKRSQQGIRPAGAGGV